jgi:hypothetical protein
MEEALMEDLFQGFADLFEWLANFFRLLGALGPLFFTAIVTWLFYIWRNMRNGILNLPVDIFKDIPGALFILALPGAFSGRPIAVIVVLMFVGIEISRGFRDIDGDVRWRALVGYTFREGGQETSEGAFLALCMILTWLLFGSEMAQLPLIGPVYELFFPDWELVISPVVFDWPW